MWQLPQRNHSFSRNLRAFRSAAVEATRVSVAALLLVAAYLKATSLRDVHDSYFLVGGVAVEVVIALWLLSGICSRVCWVWTGLLFCLFATVAIVKIATGAPTCNCFGEFSTTPTHTLILDLVVVAIAATQLWPLPATRTAQNFVTGSFAIRCGVCICVVLFAGYYFAPRFDPDLVRPSIAPSAWIGKAFPLPVDRDTGVDIRSGSWTVVIYRPGCHECDVEVERHLRAAPFGMDNLLLLTLSSDDTWHGTPRAVIAFGVFWEKLTDEYVWTGPVPLVARVVDGIVVES